MVSYHFKLTVFFFFTMLFIREAYSYCVYNQFTDGTSIHIFEIETYVPEPRVFNKLINGGANECCPYSNWDCCIRKVDYDTTRFKVYFRFPKYNSRGHLVRCYSGGAIAFYGDETNYWAECSDAQGNVKKIAIIASDEG